MLFGVWSSEGIACFGTFPRPRFSHFGVSMLLTVRERFPHESRMFSISTSGSPRLPFRIVLAITLIDAEKCPTAPTPGLSVGGRFWSS
uniref:Uncharacterized protein n=1 Tax=Physcomitrium patens TaxID=3218 RepID=A0A2K1KXP9_PHYPA|nr:hypothetical protein PHYPA_005521 [Physcomitrium patens]